MRTCLLHDHIHICSIEIQPNLYLSYQPKPHLWKCLLVKIKLTLFKQVSWTGNLYFYVPPVATQISPALLSPNKYFPVISRYTGRKSCTMGVSVKPFSCLAIYCLPKYLIIYSAFFSNPDVIFVVYLTLVFSLSCTMVLIHCRTNVFIISIKFGTSFPSLNNGNSSNTFCNIINIVTHQLLFLVHIM